MLNRLSHIAPSGWDRGRVTGAVLAVALIVCAVGASMAMPSPVHESPVHFVSMPGVGNPFCDKLMPVSVDGSWWLAFVVVVTFMAGLLLRTGDRGITPFARLTPPEVPVAAPIPLRI